MKKFYSLLAIAMFFFVLPMGMMGQTKTTQTATYGFESGDAGWTATTFVTNNTAITAHGGTKFGATNGSTADVKFDNIVANPISLTCYYSKTTTNTNAGSHFEIQVSTNNSTWTKVAEGLGMDKVTKGTWYELTADLSSYSNVYVRVRYDGTTGVRALDDITLTYDDGNTPSTDPEISFTPSSITLDEVLVGNQVSTTFSVSQANLTSGITLSVDNGNLSPSSIAQGAAATTVTWTYTPTEAGTISATITATSGTTTETLAISGTAIAPVEGYDVDFEYATNMYPNWTFNNLESYQTGSITAHGGTYYGTTGGKSTASITTTSTIANPGTLTCFVSKQTGNTTSSTWYIQVSEDGSTWTDVKNQSATSMSQGSWTEFTANLTDYSDVYVRVYYSGSTAVRNIDDLTLTTVIPSPAVATTTTINVPANFNTDIYTSTTAGTLTATVTAGETTLSGVTVAWESNDETVATIDANGAVTLVAVGTTTITASYAGVEDEYRPSSDTYELTVSSSEPIPGTETDPYTVAEAITFIDGLNGETSSEVYVTGIISQIDSYSGQYHSITYWISDDGTTTNQLEVYSGKGLNGANFNSADDLIIGSTVTVKGNLKKYNDVYEFNYNSEIVSLTPPAQHTLTAAMTNVAEYFVFVGNDEIEFDNNNQAQVYEGVTVYVSLTMEDCYAVNSLTVNGSTTGVTEEEPGVYYSFVMPEGDATIAVSSTQATEYTLTVVGVENVTFDILAGSESTPVTLTNGTVTLCEQSYVTIANLTANSGLLIQSVTLTAGGSTTTLTSESGVYTFNMPSNNATLTITTAEVPTYTLATSIESGKTYIIVGFDNSDNAYAMGTQNNNNRAGVGITVDGTTATGNADVHEVVITALEGADAGKYTIEDGGYLYASSSTGNQLKTETNLDENGNGKWTIVIADGVATITAQGNNSRNRMRFNPNNGSPLFACYATNSSTGSLPRLYVKNETPATEDFYRIIDEYSSGADGWYLIASPVTVDIENNSMVSGDYDLYRYNPTANLVWENYKNNQHSDFTTLEVGRGYLYANGNDGGTILTFTGVPYSGDGQITMPYEGLNLVGNPFGVEATANKPYYKMNDAHTEVLITPSSENIDVAEGVFVSASQAGDIVTFTPADKKSNNSKSAMVMNLSRNSSIVDRAIVRFGNNDNMPKFQLFENSTKLYINQDGEDYAIVGAEEQGEMPVNFKASENGSYTISFDTENTTMGYLHLIDNLTGNDVDLLATPSYTFNAKTDDYASRFRVVFSANGNESNDSFAFVSNGQIIVNGQGTVQVYDVTGRMISSHNDVNHITTEGMTAGVYVIRLNNGNDVKTQRIVVK